jgi:hypothetical protein
VKSLYAISLSLNALFCTPRTRLPNFGGKPARALSRRRDSSVDIETRLRTYGQDDRGYRARFPERAGNFSLHHRVQNGSGAHPASYPMDSSGSFPGGKAAGV